MSENTKSRGGGSTAVPHRDVERQPLLAGTNESPDAAKSEAPPFPWFRFGILLVMRLAEPISFSVIFPFVNPMMEELTGAQNVGMYAGLIESLFMATQCTTLLYWGAASDRRGRKPILLLGLLGSSTSIVLFGLAKAFWWAVVARCLAGALNGNVAVVKSTVAELVPKEYHPIAFSSLSVVWSLGVTVGPFLGGYLSQPAKEYPSVFGPDAPWGFGGFWETYPYFLPCLVSGAITWSAILLGFFQLQETLPRIVKRKQKKEEQRRQERQEGNGTSEQRSPSASEPQPRPTPNKRLSRFSWYGSMRRSSEQQPVTPESPETPPHLQRRRSQRFQPKIGRVSSFYSGFTPTVSQVPSPSHTPRPDGQPTETVPAAIQRLHESGIQQTQEQGEYSGTNNTGPRTDSDDSADSGSISSILRTPHIQRLLITQAFLSLTMVGIDSMQVLYFYEPVEVGGLFLTPSQTGLILSLAGFLGVFSQVAIFPPLQRLLGSLRLYRLALALLPFSVVLLPLANVIARSQHLPTVTEKDWAIWIPIALSNGIRILSAMGFAANMLLVNQSASLFRSIRLGTLNALAQMAASGSRAIGPICFSSLLSITFSQQLLRGYLAWLVLAIVACGGILTSLGLLDVERMIRQGEINERIEGQDEDEEEIEQEARQEQEQERRENGA